MRKQELEAEQAGLQGSGDKGQETSRITKIAVCHELKRDSKCKCSTASW